MLAWQFGPSTAERASAKLHDFGTATEGEKLQHVFEVKNTGIAPLLIDRVTTSCGCTAAVVKSKEIAPGASGKIEVTFDTSARRGTNRLVTASPTVRGCGNPLFEGDRVFRICLPVRQG